MSKPFHLQIDDLLTAELQQNIQAVGTAVLMLHEGIVNGTEKLDGTPIDTGAAAANWLVGVDNEPTEFDPDKKGRAAIHANKAKAQATVLAALNNPNRPPKYFVIANNAPYIKMLEFGLYPNPPKKPTGKTVGGFSTQAPQGMFRVAVADWQRCLQQVTKNKGKS